VLSSRLAERLQGKLCRIALFLALVYLVAGSFGPVMDNVDLGWHVAQGRWMVEHRAIYRQDVMNYPNLNRPLVDEYPLFQVVLDGAVKLGWWGPCLLTAVGYGLLLAIPVAAARRWQLGESALLVLSLGAMILFWQVGSALRPHLVTYLGVMTLGVFLLRHREVRSGLEFWPMGFLQIAWTNCHSGFVLGPALVGLFGLEVTVRRSLFLRRMAWRTAGVWLGAFLLMFLACLVNPFGFARFYPPFFQDQLEAIRAYVGEMEPLPGASASLYGEIAFLAAAAVGMVWAMRRGAISYSFLLLAVLFYLESLQVRKSWPIFGLFPPLLILSSGAFAPAGLRAQAAGWFGLALSFLLAAILAIGVIGRLDENPGSVQSAWREFDLGRSELPFQAIDWMRAKGIEGRLLHRCEDGGQLQESGYDRGETFADTGFGKYDEEAIHLAVLPGERAGLLPRYLDGWRPADVVCGNLSYQWPYYLRQKGWRLIFYAPNGSVWTQAATRPDLPTISADGVKAAFLRDLAQGRPENLILFGRNLLALNSLGLEDFVFAQLTSLPDEIHHEAWYWEAARILCFETPRFSDGHRRQLLKEADALKEGNLTAEFRAYAHEAEGDRAGAKQILAGTPVDQLGAHASDLLLKLELADHDPGALALAERPGGFDLRDGWHWAYAAEAEERAGRVDEARRSWHKAVFYYPDEKELLAEATQFAERTHDSALQHEIEAGVFVPMRP
jgi:hypothetical protein